ncbi:hypothetical protein ACLQ3K_14980 [Tsukamurella sp. DT100]|uniref:hypothetical protein n=1 Tax=Tsukamurella sp. DT100 TaxID=3393415 RepID=UPI003CE93A11
MGYWIGFAAGWMVALAVLIPGAARLGRRYPMARTWLDLVLGGVAAFAALLVVTLIANRVWPHRPAFVRGALSGAVVGAVAWLPDVVAALRHRKGATQRPSVSPGSTPRPVVVPAEFADAVHRHFAEPTVRARYVIAAYRRGLLAPGFVPGLAADLAPLLPDGDAWAGLAGWQGGEGLDDAVDRAAGEIGYAPSTEEERDDVVERLVYWALCSDDPRARRDVLELLGEAVEPRTTFEDIGFRTERVKGLRELLQSRFDSAYGVRLGEGVHRRFTGPTAGAVDLIAGYRTGMIFSADVARIAALVIAELPGAGQAWAELAMASADEPRSELLPIVDRAAEEIGYERTPQEVEIDVLEGAAYRAVVHGSEVEESQRLHRIEFDFDHARELEELRDAWYLPGADDTRLARVRGDLAAYLARRYG